MSQSSEATNNDKTKNVQELKCCNCGVLYYQHSDVHKQYGLLFHSTCPSCIQTCSECGQEIGYAKETALVSYEACQICQKETCMNCGINVHCPMCDIVACENCVEDGNESICKRVKYIVKYVRKFK